MSTNDIIFTGIDVSSGRKPIAYAALDHDLHVVLLERCDLSHVITHLEQYRQVMLGINRLLGGKSVSAKRGQRVYLSLKKKIAWAGFKPYLKSHAPRQWVETNPPECYRALAGQTPLPRRTFGGQIQRALILYEEGLQINDPMQFFEEITRHRLMAGVLPTELIYSASELDALAAAYLVWMLINKPVGIRLGDQEQNGMVLIPREDKKRERG